MTQLIYTVVCVVQESQQADAWLAWLKNGHLADVCRAGAEEAWAVRLDGGPPYRMEAHYRFASRQAFETYERVHAPRLREEGLQLFPTADGFAYERRLGELVARHRDPE